ncbi:MAG TPA: hypothetical protein VF987_02845 [Rhodospirillales bacterium]
MGVASLAAYLVACAEPSSATRPPSGSMDVLGPIPAFEPSALPSDWITEGTVGPGQLAVVVRDGIPALMVVNGGHNFVAAKPTRASLLATPYLSWAWNMEMRDSGTHPVRLVVGFVGGDRQSPARSSPSPESAAHTLPTHDRAIVIAWSDSALERGAIVKPDAAKVPQPPARYTARGGRENAGSWWLETVDLSDIYRRSWPDDDATSARIAFIGIASSAGKQPSPAYLSGIRLSR